MASLAATVVEKFQSRYQRRPARLFRAPGRVNLIGEHTDYNLGLVLPMAIDLACYVAASPSNDGRLTVHSEQLGETVEWPLNAIAATRRRVHWSDRVVGVAWEILRRGGTIPAQQILIDSAVPLGGGLSSSAALGVSLALAFGGRSPKELADIAHAAEVDFVGIPCGVMDQFTSAHGIEGAAILLDCRTLDWRAVKLPADTTVIAVNSMIRHELASSGYRDRVEECNQAARRIGVESLRDANFDDLRKLDGTLLRRARHVISENQRVEQFVGASEQGRLQEMGRLLIESHRSLRDDFEVSCAELDFLVETALGLNGVFGARMTGGGFGGSIMVLGRSSSTRAIEPALISAYRERQGILPEVHVCNASGGASEVFI